MRILVLSDLHLGNGGDYDIFAGAECLPSLLERFIDPPTQVILNGDSVDFLLNDAPLRLEVEQAVSQAEAIAAAQSTAPVLHALGRICAAGGQVLIRMGNHDLELVHPAVQKRFRRHLNQDDSVAERMVFQRGDTPLLLNVEGARILITHGEQQDPFNQIDYNLLPPLQGTTIDRTHEFKYPPGSLLIKEILNPLKKQFRMRFIDLLKPDFQGAVLTALAVDPAAVKAALKGESLQIILRAIENIDKVTFDVDIDKSGLSNRLFDAALTTDEIDLLIRQLQVAPEQIEFGLLSELIHELGLKLTKAGLKVYARLHRQAADSTGRRYFSFEPGRDEMDEVHRLGLKFGADAVITGHSHASRWKQEKDFLYANTGTWIWLMRLPEENANDDEWIGFLQDLKADPRLESKNNRDKLEKRFTLVTIEPKVGEGAWVAMRKWKPDGELSILYQGAVMAR